MTRADIPNLISVLRILLVAPVVLALASERFDLALVLFAVAGISDGLDGYIAKRFGFESRLGSILDPLADKLLLVATYLVLAWLMILPWWLAVAVVSRDLLILVFAVSLHFFIGEYTMEPSLISKFNTVAQITLGLTAVLSAWSHAVPGAAIDWLTLLVLVTTVVSGIDYGWTWGIRAWRARLR